MKKMSQGIRWKTDLNGSSNTLDFYPQRFKQYAGASPIRSKQHAGKNLERSSDTLDFYPERSSSTQAILAKKIKRYAGFLMAEAHRFMGAERQKIKQYSGGRFSGSGCSPVT